MLPDRVVEALRGLPRPVCAYVYDRAVLRARAAALTAVLPAGARLLYAVKANGHPEVIRALASTVDGYEVASGGELALVASAGTAGAARPLVAFSGPAKTDDELAAAHAHGCVIHVESAHELRRLAALVPAGGPPARVAIRVNRAGAVPAGTHRMTGEPTPFGVDASELPAVLALAAELSTVDFIGFHLHAVSNNLDASAHVAFVRDALDWAGPRPYVNVGGGLGVDYTGATEFDLDALRGLPAHPGLVLEPGRWLAADAGWYAAEVLDVKRSHGRWFAVLRGGTHHFRLPAAWGYSHPFEVLPVDAWPYPFARPQVRDARVDLVGELCTPRDVLARDAYVRHLRAGDIAVLPRTGAYGWDISHHEFLRHPYPQTVFVG